LSLDFNTEIVSHAVDDSRRQRVPSTDEGAFADADASEQLTG